jgi:hypothetical protein
MLEKEMSLEEIAENLNRNRVRRRMAAPSGRPRQCEKRSSSREAQGFTRVLLATPAGDGGNIARVRFPPPP